MRLGSVVSSAFLLYGLCLILSPPVRAQTSGAAFLSVDPSPRSYALGSADSISDPGAQSVDRNPSLMGLMSSKYELFTAYQQLIGGAQYEHFAFAAQPYFLSPYIDAIGVGFTQLNINDIQGADASGNATGSFSAGNSAAAIGASSLIDPNLRFGLDGKAVKSTISSYSSNWALAADLGMTWIPPFRFMGRSMTWAACADNLGQGQKFISQTDKLPAAIKAGAALPILSHSVGFFQVQNLIYDHVTTASAGLEFTYKIFAVRGGYRYQFGNPSNLALTNQGSFSDKALDGLSGGIGIHWEILTVDYAISQQGVDYGATQRIALTLSWGEKGKTEEIKTIRPETLPDTQDYHILWR